MERGSLNKKAPFKMKGYSYPGKSPIKQTNYFKTDLFTNPYDKYKDMTNDELMDPYLKNRKDAMEQGKYLSADGTYDYASDPKYKDRFKPTKSSQETSSTTKTKSNKSKGMNTELLFAAAMPIPYLIASLFGGKNKKQEIAEDVQKQEKKVKDYNYQKGLDSFSTVEETNAMTEKNIAKKKKKKEQQERSKRFKKHNTALGPTIIG